MAAGEKGGAWRRAAVAEGWDGETEQERSWGGEEIHQEEIRALISPRIGSVYSRISSDTDRICLQFARPPAEICTLQRLYV